MDFTLLEQLLEIANEKNITKAANNLFISQSALNRKLIHIEEELGTQLFLRSKNNWKLTEAGNIYMDTAKKIIQLKKEAYDRIQDLSNGTHGHLSVGFTAGRGVALFSRAFPAFRKAFPNVLLEPREGTVREQLQMVHSGELDIGFVTLTDADKTDDTFETIYKEELLLALPFNHPAATHAQREQDNLPTLDIQLLQKDSFVLMDKTSTMHTLLEQTFRELHFNPNILFETGNNRTILSMIQSGICCGVIAHYYAQSPSDGISFFRLANHPTWDFCTCYRKDWLPSAAARFYIELIRSLCAKNNR